MQLVLEEAAQLVVAGPSHVGYELIGRVEGAEAANGSCFVLLLQLLRLVFTPVESQPNFDGSLLSLAKFRF